MVSLPNWSTQLIHAYKNNIYTGLSDKERVNSVRPKQIVIKKREKKPHKKLKRSNINYFLTIYFLTETTQKCTNFVDTLLGRRGHRTGRGHCMGRFCPSCVRLVYFLRKSTEFHVKRTECQRILLLEQSLSAALFHIRSTITPAALFHVLCTITPQSLPNFSLITPQSNYASVYPPSFDTFEWMEMQIGLPLAGLTNLFHGTYSLPQRLQNWTLLQR